MSADERPSNQGAPRPAHDADVRLRGFADRAPLHHAHAWIDGHVSRLAAVEVPVADAVGRLAAEPVVATSDQPAYDRAAEDGYAVRAADTVGASGYGPVLLPVTDDGGALPPGAARLVSAGGALPAGADAVIGFDAAQGDGGQLEVIAPVAEGSGVERVGQLLRAGRPVIEAGRRLGALEVALLAAAGVDRVRVVARPRVRLAIAGAKAGGPDAHRALLRSLVERDGGVVEVSTGPEALRRALAGAGADVVLGTGRTGTGPDDGATVALAAAGEVALHGLALRPGGSMALGLASGIPVALLPGDPLACAVAYELVAARLVRLLAGLGPALPHVTREAEATRKIVSAVGFVDVCQVRLAGGGAEPVGIAEPGGLAAAARADGFVVVPAALEGWPPGSRVTVHLYRG